MVIIKWSLVVGFPKLCSFCTFLFLRRADSIVSIATRLWAGCCGSDTHHGLQTLLQNYPDQPRGSSSLLFNGHRGSFPRVKEPGREADHSPQSSDEAKNMWRCTSSQPLCLHDVEREATLLVCLLYHHLVDSDVRT